MFPLRMIPLLPERGSRLFSFTLSEDKENLRSQCRGDHEGQVALFEPSNRAQHRTCFVHAKRVCAGSKYFLNESRSNHLYLLFAQHIIDESIIRNLQISIKQVYLIFRKIDLKPPNKNLLTCLSRLASSAVSVASSLVIR